MSNVNEPTATAFHWSITAGDGKNYELACFAVQIFNTEVGLRCVYRSTGGEWMYLLSPSLYNEDSFDETTTKILESISKKVREFFVLDAENIPVPVTLFEKVEQLLHSNVEWKENSLTKL